MAKVDGVKFAKALALVARATGSGAASMPILGGVWITAVHNRLRLVATDLETYVTAEIECADDGDDAFERIVSAKRLKGATAKIRGVLELTATERTHLIVTAGGAKYEILGDPLEEYPWLPAVDCAHGSVWKAKDFAEALGRVMHAVSDDPYRPSLRGVYVEHDDERGVRFTATDGYRIAGSRIAQATLPADKPVLVPANGLKLVQRALSQVRSGEVGVFIEAGFIRFALPGQVTIDVRLIESGFPNYRQIVDQVECVTEAAFDSAALAAVLRQAARYWKIVTLSLDGACVVGAHSIDSGSFSSSVPCEKTGPDAVTGINAGYLADELEARNELVFIGLGKAPGTDPIRVRGETGRPAIIMPAR